MRNAESIKREVFANKHLAMSDVGRCTKSPKTKLPVYPPATMLATYKIHEVYNAPVEFRLSKKKARNNSRSVT